MCTSAKLGSNHPQYENIASENTLVRDMEYSFWRRKLSNSAGGLELGIARKKGQKRKKAFFRRHSARFCQNLQADCFIESADVQGEFC